MKARQLPNFTSFDTLLRLRDSERDVLFIAHWLLIALLSTDGAKTEIAEIALAGTLRHSRESKRSFQHVDCEIPSCLVRTHDGTRGLSKSMALDSEGRQTSHGTGDMISISGLGGATGDLAKEIIMASWWHFCTEQQHTHGMGLSYSFSMERRVSGILFDNGVGMNTTVEDRQLPRQTLFIYNVRASVLRCCSML